MKVWFVLLLIPLAVAGCGRAGDDGNTERPLLWAADAEGGLPYICRDENDPDRFVGFEVELAAALSQELGRPIEPKQYEFQSLGAGSQRGDFDLAMNGLEVTPDRRKTLRLTRPYYVYTLQLVARADETRFRSLDECKAVGGVVGTLEDTAAQRLLDRMQVKESPYGNQTEPYKDLELGRLDAVLLDLPIAMYYAKPNENLKFVGQSLDPGYYAIGLAKDNAALAGQLDAALERLLENGQLRRIYEKWGIWNRSQEQLFKLYQMPVEKALDTPPVLIAEDSAAADVRDAVAASSEAQTFSYYFPLLLQGAGVTVALTFASMFVAMVLGMVIATARLYGPRPVQGAAILYVEFFRGIPVLLLLFTVYYGLPEIAKTCGLGASLNLPAWAAAIITFGLDYAAYESEIYRAGIASIPKGQWEAAASLGMSRPMTFRLIILPQAIRVILPPSTNDFVALFKDTSLVSIIAVVELTKQYQMLTKSSLRYLEIGLVTAALYLVMSVPLGYLSRYLEKRWGKGHA